ncbi:IS110 family transposase [Segeticoccus rhizosphaerae]|uniref:IS110 family transposase n=1 Tax=Segeticoccus rhizosphaerae TaxID=1104777 RepID=UPI0010C00D11|nr:IS110 family transposase [Ornithinicoccus soli]
MLFLGDDWAETHHDIELQDEQGRVLKRRRLAEGVAGLAQLHELIADHLDDDDEPESVLVGIETDRGGWVNALVAAGYTVYAINPKQAARYRERLTTSGAKSDPGDAHVLAEIVRKDREHHRVVAGDSEQVEVVKTVARTHQAMIWTRQRQANQLRSMLREFYPAALEAFGDDLAGRDALAVLAIAPTPAAGRALSRSRLVSVLRKAGRQRNLQTRAEEISTVLRGEHLGLSDALAEAYGASVRALVAVLTTMAAQAVVLEGEVERCFGQHPDADLITSQPGLGAVLGARVLAEFGDDKDRYADAKSRRNYAGTSPITKTSGKQRVVLARYARNKRLADALHQQAFAALTASPGARAFYDHHRARGATHHQALRALSNRLVGILDGCLRHRTTYDEAVAWAHRQPAAA